MFELTRGLVPTLELIDTLTGRTSESGMIGDVRTVIAAEANLTGTAKKIY